MPCWSFRTGIGIDSHAFDDGRKPLILGGLKIPYHRGLQGNSDGDVVLHAITDAISGITGRNIIGPISDDLCNQGITDSRIYLQHALADLNIMGFEIENISITIEAAKPKLEGYIGEIRRNIAEMINKEINRIGITVTSGEGLSDFGRGLGIKSIALVTVRYRM